MLFNYSQIEELKINNSVVTYLIVFFILLPLSYIKGSLPDDFRIFTYTISKIVLLLFIILLTVTGNKQIAFSVAIFLIYIFIYNNEASLGVNNKKK